MATKLTVDRVLTQRQLKALLKEIGREKDAAIANGVSSKFIVDFFFISIAANTGLRISELAALVWCDVQVNYLVVRRGKGGRKRSVMFGARTTALFEEYKLIYAKSFCPPDSDKRLFLGKAGKPLTRWGLHKRFSYWKKRLGFPKSITMHSTRHYCLTYLLDQGVPLQTVRDFAGHSNISTTSGYLHLTQEAKDRLIAVL